MAPSIYEITLAGLLHDIGKLYQRAHWGQYKPHTQWTSSLITGHKDLKDLWKKYGIETKRLAETASHHHQAKPEGWQPKTAAAWAVTLADNYASSEREESAEKGGALPYQVSPQPIFNRVHIGNENTRNTNTNCSYSLKPLATDAVFPVRNPGTVYEDIADRLTKKLESLAKNPPRGIEALVANINAFLQELTWAIPSDTVGEPDVSLYDHLRLTAAFAAALWAYHQESDGEVTIESLREENKPKFLLVAGDIGGIQNHIYRIRHSSATGVGSIAKRLRARSLEVALATEALAYDILDNLKLSQINRILSAGGRFTLLVQNTPSSVKKLEELSAQWQRWALERGGTLTPTLAWVEFGPSDLETTAFGTILARLSLKLAEAKQQPHANVGGDYLPFTSSAHSLRPCPVCDALPSAGMDGDGNWLPCSRCQAEANIGQQLPKASKIYLSRSTPPEPRYDFPKLAAALEPAAGSVARQFRTRLDFSPDEEAFEVRPLTGRVPSVADAQDFLGGKEQYLEWMESHGLSDVLEELGHHPDRPLTFEEIAQFATGSKYLAALMIDADKMGEIFTRGFEEHLQTPSRIGSLSRMLEFFFGFVATDLMLDPERFSKHLPPQLMNNVRKRYRTIYSVYAGGDDVFVIGPWDVLIHYARDLQALYRAYTCNHPAFTLSGGLVLIKPHTPVPLIADYVQAAEKKAKSAGRNRLTLFGHAIAWEELDRLLEHGQRFYELTASGELPRGLGYRLLNLWAMFKDWQYYKDPIGLKYKPLLFYQKRNSAVDRHWNDLFKPLMNHLDPRMQHLPVWVQYALYQGR